VTRVRRLEPVWIPLLVIAVTGALVAWAFPDDVSPARGTGIMLGWVGCGLLLSSLLLMLREPRLARTLGGLERMYLWHHWTGFAAYVVLLAHPLALAADAWPQTPDVAWQTISPFSESWPVWVGWLSLLLLMAGLAATFAVRLSYRARRWLHAALGPGVALGLVHLMLLGVEEPVAPLLAVCVLLLGWRALREDWGLGALPYVVGAARRVARDTVEIELRPLARPIPASPGQFVVVAFHNGPGFHGCREFHPFTVSGIDAEGRMRVAVKAVGDCTRRIQSLVPGVLARVQGAFGTLMDDRATGAELWVAGGMGVTPFLSLLRAGHLRAPTTLLYLYRTQADAAFLTELAALEASDARLDLRAVPTGEGLPDLDALLPGARDLSGREAYVCGPAGLIDGVTRALRARGVTPRHIHSEQVRVL
jgi:predicted ferric reductase